MWIESQSGNHLINTRKVADIWKSDTAIFVMLNTGCKIAEYSTKNETDKAFDGLQSALSTNAMQNSVYQMPQAVKED